MSLAGVPPLSGFFAKLTLIQGGLEAERYAIVVAALVVSLLTLFSMTKIWAEAFWKPAPENGAEIVCVDQSWRLSDLACSDRHSFWRRSPWESVSWRGR